MVSLLFINEKISNNQISFSFSMEESDQYFIMGKTVELSQVLINLISNACDAISNQDEKWIKVNFQKTSEQIIISIIDSGAGIPKDIQEKIMQPFFTTKEINKGTGLGLSLSKTIIEKHNGTISIDNLSKNTKFDLKLPLIANGHQDS